MALTISNVARTVFGNKRVVFADVTFDNSYPTGGLDLAPGDFGLRHIDFINPTTSLGYIFQYDAARGKLLAFRGTSEVTNGTNLAAVTTRTMVVGY